MSERAHNPCGIGLYLRGLSKNKHGTPRQAAKRARDNGISFVAILACWQDRHNGRDRHLASNGADGSRIAAYAEAFAAAGVAPWIWGFPRGGWEDKYVERMRRVTDACDGVIVGWLHDPEVYYKWKSGSARRVSASMRGQPEFTAGARVAGSKPARKAQAQRLVDLSLDAMDESLGLGITSYGMAQYHKNFPWAEFGGVGWGSPQLYSVSPKQVDQGIAAWRVHGWEHIVPSVPTFGKNSGANLHDHLSGFVDGDDNIAGFVFWSWRQTSRDEWRILARWAEWLNRGACNGW